MRSLTVLHRLGFALCLSLFAGTGIVASAFAAPAAPTPTPTPGPFKIGALLSLTGSGKPFAEDFKVGAEIAIDELNKLGGVSGQPVKLVAADLESSVSLVSEKYKHLVQVEKVDALIGDVLERTSRQMIVLTNTYSRVLMSPALFDTTLPVENRFVFSLLPNKLSLRGAVERFYTVESGLKRIAVLCSSTENGVVYLDVWRDLAVANGVTIAEEMCGGDTGRDFRIDVARAQAHDPQGLLLSVAAEQVLPWMDTFGFKPVLLGTRDFVDAVTLGRITPARAEGTYVLDWQVGQLLSDLFQARTGRKPTFAGQLGYEGVRALGRGARANRTSLIEGLRTLRYDSAGGPMDFTFEFGPNKSRGLLRRYQGGILTDVQ